MHGLKIATGIAFIIAGVMEVVFFMFAALGVVMGSLMASGFVPNGGEESLGEEFVGYFLVG